jgi:superfamily II DNA or RNA helicase
MPKKASRTGSELFIVDNSDEAWKVAEYMRRWCNHSSTIDVATGYFDIGALLCLGENWQQVDKIRILVGDDLNLRTVKAIRQALTQRAADALNESFENEKAENPFLQGVPAILKGMADKKIEIRIYSKKKFHAKAYITHARDEIIPLAGLVGSSNFTYAGLNQNVELNVRITGDQVNVLQEWFEEHWNDADDVTHDMLQIVEKHVREYSPFEVYARFLHEFFRHYDIDKDLDAWLEDSKGSQVWKALDDYQKEAFRDLIEKARTHKGAFLCDGVGLGKTLTGLMVVEYFVAFRKKNVLLLVPKAANEAVWKADIARFAPNLARKRFFGGLRVQNHTDLTRKANDETDFPALWESVAEDADVVLIDEAHHFRNRGIKGKGKKEKSRYWKLFDVVEGKTMFMLTATPVNNRLTDLQHMIELFTHGHADHFRLTLGINSVPGHFRTLEKNLEALMADADDAEEAADVLANSPVFRGLVVQRSRGYVIESQKRQGKPGTLFPDPKPPQVQDYSLKKTYGKLLKIVEKAFDKEKPLLNLSMYYPLAYPIDRDNLPEGYEWEEGRQKQVAALIRTQFLKRFESSWVSFDSSCFRLLRKVRAWIRAQEPTGTPKKRLGQWEAKHESAVKRAEERHRDLHDDEVQEEDDIIDEMALRIEKLDRKVYNVDDILNESIDDLHQLCDFLTELEGLNADHDDKLKQLTSLLKTDPVLSKHKVIIFTEFKSTARYLETHLNKAGFTHIEEVDSERANHRDRVNIIKRFSPYYNGTTSAELADAGETETRILISTDVLAEGLNLQDATRLINYDLHWNPVRLMQRIGRVNRRLNQEVEDAIVKDHPDQKPIRRTTGYWNFLPPDELDELLALYNRVHKKVLRISKTLGIEYGKLLRPDDDYEVLKEFNRRLEDFGKTPFEDMRRTYNAMLDADASLEARLNEQPQVGVFSGKEHIHPDAQTVLFCYNIPGPPLKEGGGVDHSAPAESWSEKHGRTVWLRYDVDSGDVDDNAPDMMPLVSCEPATPRRNKIKQATLKEVRAEVEKHIKNNHLKAMNAPVGVKPTLKAWMELN